MFDEYLRYYHNETTKTYNVSNFKYDECVCEICELDSYLYPPSKNINMYYESNCIFRGKNLPE